MNKEELLVNSFQAVFEKINQEGIKESVDKKGIDQFISDCASLAAITGAATGFTGFTIMIVGFPADVINNVFQQFRVTLGVIYDKKGVYKVSFSEFMTIVGVSVGVEVGANLTKAVMSSIANKILIRLFASSPGKAVPFVGAFIGGSINYGFIKAIGAAVKKIDMSSIVFDQNSPQNDSNDQQPRDLK
ncbi:hypothetical protein [Moorena sp. SIO3H5]|uniref:hypothetical protein n=1 Tax=Moorena sp. SIO3H5 TaxID=2607834 RepID=UPI0013BACEC6|nr:hypothetical protein [Moorena sp. SIO3H5]NEO69226.1 hypothetical protein [Moorena sp. SIO3H5]